MGMEGGKEREVGFDQSALERASRILRANALK